MSMNNAQWSLSITWNFGRMPAAEMYGLRSRDASMKSIRAEPVSMLGGCPICPCRAVIGSTSDMRLVQEANLLLWRVMLSFASIRIMISCPSLRSVVMVAPKSASSSALGSLGSMPWSAAIRYCWRKAVLTPDDANFWSQTRYTEKTVTLRPSRPVRVRADHLPMWRGSEIGWARVPHFSPAIVSVPPGWNEDWYVIAELENANAVRVKYLFIMLMVDARLSFQFQSVFVSTNPRMLTPSS